MNKKNFFSLIFSIALLFSAGDINAQCGNINLSYSGLNQTSVTLNWNSMTPTPTNYNIYFQNPFEYIASVNDGNTISYNITGLEPGTTYTICVNVYCNWQLAGESCVTFTTPDTPPTGSCGDINLSYSNLTSNSVTLNWNSMTPTPTNFNVYFQNPFQYIGSVGNGNATSYTVNNLTPNTSYTICVNVYCDWELSGESCVSFTTN